MPFTQKYTNLIHAVTEGATKAQLFKTKDVINKTFNFQFYAETLPFVCRRKYEQLLQSKSSPHFFLWEEKRNVNGRDAFTEIDPTYIKTHQLSDITENYIIKE